MISIVLPSRDRPDSLGRSLANLWATTHKEDVEVLVVLDPGDERSLEEARIWSKWPAVRVVMMPDTYVNGHPQQKYQAGYLAAQGDWIITAADDIVFEDGWLVAALAWPNQGVIGLADPNWCGMLMNLVMASRTYIETVMHGRLGLPWYYVWWADNEWTARAQAIGAATWCPDTRYQHLHADYSAQPDSQRDLTAPLREKDALTFQARLAAGFPEEWPEV